MAILSALNGEHFGTWTSIEDYLQDVNRRETGSLAALNAALSAPPADQRELGEGEGALVLADVAGDLRVQRGSRLAAIRCAMEAGVSGPILATLFIGGGELATDPRLGAHARKLVEAGIPAVLGNSSQEAARVGLAAGAFARSVHAAASVVGQTRLKELLAGAPPAHAGVNAALFALGQAPLPAGEVELWTRLLRTACAANRSAPAAAKRLGMAPPWPPNLPDAFKELIAAAEKYAASVVAIDAAKGGVVRGTAGPPSLSPTSSASGRPAPPPPNAPPIQGRAPSSPRAGSLGAPQKPEAVPQPPGAAPARPQAPIHRSPYRKPIGTVMEGKFVAPTQRMSEVRGQSTPSSKDSPPTESAAPGDEAPIRSAVKSAPLPGIAPLPSLNLSAPTFDARGKRVPRPDRWRDTDFDWEEPILPSNELKPPARVSAALGPFALRLKSLFEDRPEAVDRICAAAEARAAIVGEDQLLAELTAELRNPRWKRASSPEQLARLDKVAEDQQRPEPWRRAARLLLDHLRRPPEA